MVLSKSNSECFDSLARCLCFLQSITCFPQFFCQVKVQTWVNKKEKDEFVGVGARFGPKIKSKEKHANRTRLLLAQPSDCCTPPTEKVAFLEMII
jgi:hypothetical protein